MQLLQQFRKRTLFIVGILVTSITGLVTNYINNNYSKSESLIIPTAHADYAVYTGGGDGCGGCSGDSSY